MRCEIGAKVRLHAEAEVGNQGGSGRRRRTQLMRARRRARSRRRRQILKREPKRAVLCQCEVSREADQNRVPIEKPTSRAEAKVCPERLEKRAAGVQRHAAHNIAQRSAEEDREQSAGPAENRVAKRCPHGGLEHGCEIRAKCRAALAAKAPSSREDRSR